MTADRKLSKRLAHECLRCSGQALPDSDYCGPHRDENRRASRASHKKRREELRHSGRCTDCGKLSKKWRCPTCYRKWKDRLADTVKNASRNVKTAEIWRVDPGTNWQRYRGKGRRGRLTRQEQAEEDKRDARFAIAEIEKFITDADRLVGADVLEMPRIQREAERRKATLYLGNAGRFIDELMDKYG